MASVLIVEDEAITARDLRGIVEEAGFEVTGVCRDAASALASCDARVPDVALLDIGLQGEEDGIALAARLRVLYPLSIAFITAQADKATVRRAVSVRPNAYLVKPFDDVSVYVALETALANLGGADDADNVPTASIAAGTNDGNGLTPEQLASVLRFMDRSFARSVSLTELADVAGLSASHFAAQFKRATGKPPHQYLIGLRMEEAKRLLRGTEWTVDAIADAVGYETSAHFATAFKKIVGKTPTGFRASGP